MRKIITILSFLIIFVVFVGFTSFAQVDSFYYQNDNQLFEELWDENGTLNWTRHKNAAKNYLINKKIVDEAQFDFEKLSFDLEHVVCRVHGWTAQQVADYIKGGCSPSFLENNFSFVHMEYFVPFHYEGIDTTNYLACYYSVDKNCYFSHSDDGTIIRHPESNLMIFSADKLMKCFEEQGLVGYKPKQCILYNDMVFIICQVNGEFRLVYMPTLTEYEAVYGADPNKHDGLVDDPVFTVERFESVFSSYEQQNPISTDNPGTAIGQTGADDVDLTWLWIIGGAVVLIGGLVTVLLTVKKRQAK